jgi:two-component system, OmpR family, response regulator
MRILLVEDELELALAVTQLLREKGYLVDHAPDGESGLAKATGTDYDVIILDVMLPKLDGISVLAALRQTKKTPVLMLTARDTIADRVRGLDTGADDYLVKPFAMAELLARLRSLIRRAAGQPSPKITIGSTVLNTLEKSVTQHGQAVPLTAREYALIELLALRQGEVVSRTTIYEHLFDETDDSLSNLLEVHISNIRRKLGHDMIETRRGHGYMIQSSRT